MQRHIPALTGLRGACCVWVFLYHFESSPNFDGFGNLPVLRDGYLGVDMFFLLSGFILCHVYAGKADPLKPGNHLSFLWARFARIYPLHLFTLLLTLALVIALPGFARSYGNKPDQFSTGTFIQSLLLVQNWTVHHVTSWNIPSWSLSAEWFAYLFFPLALWGALRVRSGRLAVGLAIASLMVLAIVVTAIGRTLEPSGPIGMARMACEFLSGCLLFRAVSLGTRIDPGAAGLMVAGLLAWSLSARSMNCIAPIPMAILVMLCAQDQNRAARMFASRPLVFLGELSFSLYMLHWLILQVSNVYWRAAPPGAAVTRVIWNVSLVAAIFTVSVASYHWIELPSRRFVRRLGETVAAAPSLR